jgi:hypothetical protein
MAFKFTPEKWAGIAYLAPASTKTLGGKCVSPKLFLHILALAFVAT